MELSYLDSKIFGKVCYGFRRNKSGIVEIVPEKAAVVKTVFGLYLQGYSLENIQKYLLDNNIPSPSGKAKWSRDVLNKLLNNFKYTYGIVDYSVFSTVADIKESNCRNPNRNIEDDEVWDEQPKLNWSGHSL